MFSRQLLSTVLIKPPIHSFQHKNFLSTMSNSFKLACIQLSVTADKTVNLLKTKSKILEASRNGAKVIVLPVSSLYRADRFVLIFFLLFLKSLLLGMF